MTHTPILSLDVPVRRSCSTMGEGGQERGCSPQPPACRGDYCMRAVGLWRCGMNMLPMALGTCRDSGCSLIFLDSGKLWAFTPFSTSFFPVRKHQGQRDPRSQNASAGDSHIHSHMVDSPTAFHIPTPR